MIPKPRPAFEQRARETVRRDKNHPSVIAWTIGNENKAGQNLQVVADLVKQLDPTRPRDVSCFDGEKYHVEFDDSHYSPPSSFAKADERSRATGQPHIHLENPNTWDIRLAADAGMYERWGAGAATRVGRLPANMTRFRASSRLNGRTARSPTIPRPNSTTIFPKPASICSRSKGSWTAFAIRARRSTR